MGICWRSRAAARQVCPQRKRPTLGGGGADNRGDLEEDPSQWPCYRITSANNQQRSVLCEQCPLKRRDAQQRDDSEALGVVIHLPAATAAIHENPNPGVQMPTSDSQTA
jgi:hypothetical protein